MDLSAQYLIRDWNWNIWPMMKIIHVIHVGDDHVFYALTKLIAYIHISLICCQLTLECFVFVFWLKSIDRQMKVIKAILQLVQDLTRDEKFYFHFFHHKIMK